MTILFFSACDLVRDLHSFPTRRSSDLGTVTWNLGTKAPGTSGTVTVTVSVSSALTTLTVTVTVPEVPGDRKSTRLNSSHQIISYAVFCLKKKNSAYSVLPGSTHRQTTH